MNQRILVVDDDPDVSRVVEVNLEVEGYEVHVAHDGPSAIATAQRIRPDLVLLDVMMPGLDGYEVCKRLRLDPRTANASIIMLTARSLPADTVVGLTAGADDYIAKPFDPSELVARVLSALRRTRQMREVSPLTGMPGNAQISLEIDRLLADGEARFAVIYADLDNFKAFNDHYSWTRGDDAIIRTADVIVEVLQRHPSEAGFAGPSGGDDFVVITSPEVAEAVCRDLVSSFDSMVAELYDEEDRQRGWIEVEDRLGQPHRYQLMTISVGVATNAHRPLTSRAEVSSIATEMKLLAKRGTGSTYEMDRRRA